MKGERVVLLLGITRWLPEQSHIGFVISIQFHSTVIFYYKSASQAKPLQFGAWSREKLGNKTRSDTCVQK